MKKLLLALIILVISIQADPMNDLVKSECVSQVYNKSDFNPLAYGYMMGVIDGIITTQGMNKMNSWSSNVTYIEIMKKTCKQVLKKDLNIMFYLQYRNTAYDVMYK